MNSLPNLAADSSALSLPCAFSATAATAGKRSRRAGKCGSVPCWLAPDALCKLLVRGDHLNFCRGALRALPDVLPACPLQPRGILELRWIFETGTSQLRGVPGLCAACQGEIYARQGGDALSPLRSGIGIICLGREPRRLARCMAASAQGRQALRQ